jgi:hypothetical protein
MTTYSFSRVDKRRKIRDPHLLLYPVTILKFRVISTPPKFHVPSKAR